MKFPPPPGLVFLAYSFGKISRDEFIYLTELWSEKHADRDGDTNS